MPSVPLEQRSDVDHVSSMIPTSSNQQCVLDNVPPIPSVPVEHQDDVGGDVLSVSPLELSNDEPDYKPSLNHEHYEPEGCESDATQTNAVLLAPHSEPRGNETCADMEDVEHGIIQGQPQEPLSTSFNAGRLIMKHYIFQDGGWKSRLAQPHPTVEVSIATNINDYNNFNIRNPPCVSSIIKAIVDSGAQCCLWGWLGCQKAGFRRGDLIPVQQKLNGVKKSKLTIYGALLLRFHGTSSSGENFTAAAIVYVSPDVQNFYMSQDVMVQLSIVPPNFPSIAGAAVYQLIRYHPHHQGRKRTIAPASLAVHHQVVPMNFRCHQLRRTSQQ